ncbi:MAG: metal ABC transporter permease [Anaerolineae bacterium]|nr:metal ABC transporter permease [Anaerolineae bacterium]
MNYLVEPFTYGFIQRAFICALLIGGLSGLVGVYVVLRRMSYIGHGLSYAIFGGAVISYLVRLNVYIGSALWGFLAAMTIIWTGRRRRVGADAAIGIITTASFAVGVIIANATHDFPGDVDAALFGNILTLTNNDLVVVLAASILISIVVFFGYKQLLFTAFDADAAAVFGVRTRLIDAVFSFIVAGLLIAAMQVVGVTMIAASLITPPTIARLLTNNFHRLLIISVLIGAFGGVVGVYASWYLNWATGATIVVTHAALFIVALIYSNVVRPRIMRGKQIADLRVGSRAPETGL